MHPQVQLKTTAVLNIPFQSYDSDFSFIVNGQEYKTSHFISDLISTVISHNHQVDPTLSTFTISTEHRGDFSNILKLVTFQPFSIPDNEVLFFAEVIEILGNDSIDISNLIQTELTNENVINNLQEHEKYGLLFSQRIEEEVKYISSNFFELCEKYKEEMKKLKKDTIEMIISNSNLKLQNEDQLVKFIDFLYKSEGEVNCVYSNLYSYVIFTNVSSAVIGEFIDHVRKDDLTEEAWNSISQRLKQPIAKKHQIEKHERYFKTVFLPNREGNFEGIIRYLLKDSNGNISEKVDITASPSNNCSNSPINVTHFDQDDNYTSNDVEGSWICFDFKDNRVVPTNYQIKSYPQDRWHHPKTWVIEGKENESSKWENLDSENNCSYLNAKSVSHVFPITNVNENKFRYIRMRQTGPSWCDFHYLSICSFELYGTLI